MKETNFPRLTDEQLAGFRNGDPFIINEIVKLILPPVLRWAWRQYRLLQRDDVQDIVHQVIAEICHQPQRFDPARASLPTYVIRLLKLRLADLYAKQQEVDNQEEYGPDAYEKLLSLPYNSTEVLDKDTRIVREEFFDQLDEHLEPVERELLLLMRQGRKDTNVFVAVLTRYGLVEDEDREVKNAKARLIRKMTFIVRSLGYKLEDLL
jgi:DNA-directed RNA polymerase specialized sigma24 family protein